MKGCVMKLSITKTGWARLATGAALVGSLAASGLALGQSLKEQIVGAWQYASIYNEVDGVKKYIYGEKPLGLVVLDPSGYVIGYLSKPDLPKFAANNRLKGTDEEYREVMQGMLAGFGTYSIEGDTVTINWIGSSYPNRAGTIEKRTYTVTGDEMTATNPAASSGGMSVAKFQRVR
jgi:Lipocalin-like domain